MGNNGGIVSTAIGNLGNPGMSGGKQLALNLFDPGGVMGTLGYTANKNKGYQTFRVGEDPNEADNAANAARAAQEQQAAEAQAATDTVAAQTLAKKRARLLNKSQTVYTSPLGVQDQAGISRKTLLGV